MVLDVAGLVARMGGKRDVARRMANIYLQLHPAQLVELRRVVTEKDVRAVGLQAHTIKGGAGNVGGMALRSLALQMESRAQVGNLEEACSLLPAMERESVRLLEALKAEFAEA